MNVTRIDKNKVISLMFEPVDGMLTIHYQNLVNTFGQEAVEKFFKEIIFKELKKTKQRKV